MPSCFLKHKVYRLENAFYHPSFLCWFLCKFYLPQTPNSGQGAGMQWEISEDTEVPGLGNSHECVWVTCHRNKIIPTDECRGQRGLRGPWRDSRDRQEGETRWWPLVIYNWGQLPLVPLERTQWRLCLTQPWDQCGSLISRKQVASEACEDGERFADWEENSGNSPSSCVIHGMPSWRTGRNWARLVHF